MSDKSEDEYVEFAFVCVGGTIIHMNTASIQQEISLLRSYVVSMAGKDTEGAYKPELVRRVRKALREEPTKRFKDANMFLRELERDVS